MSVLVAAWREVDPRTLHDIVRLRIDVFVVEQECPYSELDGRDVEPTTEHVWWPDDDGVAAYLRVLAEDDGSRRIGRVVTRRDARGAGLAARLVEDAVTRHGSCLLVLDAQSYLTGFYERFGFTSSGPEFLEDGIPHVPMLRTAGRRASDPQGSEATSSGSSTLGPV